MGDIRWDLLQPVDTGAQVQQGFATGMAMVKQIQSRNALRHYLANPEDEKAYSALAFYDPEAASTIQRQQMLRRKEQQDLTEAQTLRSAGAQAAGGDYSGASSALLGAGQYDAAKQIMGLQDDQAKRVHDGWEAAGALAFRLKGLKSKEEQQAYWQQNRPMLEGLGVPAKVLDSIDPTNIAQLDGIATQAQKVTDLIAQQKPQIIPLTAGGGVAQFDPGTGQTSIVIAPNPGDQQTGAPVTGGGGAGGIVQRNNPGALRKPGSTEFQRFGSPQEGIAAQEALLTRYMAGGRNTVGEIVERYAPRKGNGGDNSDASVNNYIGYVAKRIGVNPRDALSPAVVPRLAAAMREFETGQRVPVTAHHDASAVRAAAERAIAMGADPEKVRARAASQGVHL